MKNNYYQKNFTKPFPQFISKHTFLLSVLICAISTLIYLILNSITVTSTNDDYCIFKMIFSGETAIPCMGYFVSSFFQTIQPLFGKLNSYMIVQELLVFLSMNAISYVFLSKLKSLTGVIITLAFNLVFFSFLIINISFDYTAIVVPSAGVILLIYGSVYELRKGLSITQATLGVLMMFCGSQFRFTSFIALCSFVFVWGVTVFFVYIIKEIKSTSAKSGIRLFFSKYLKTVLLVSVSILIVFGTNLVSDIIKNNITDYKEVSAYNIASSNVTDYITAPYQGNEKFYNSIGIYNEADLSVYKKWFIDDDFFTKEKLIAIRDYSDKTMTSNTPNKGIAFYIFNSAIEAFSPSAESGLIILYLLALLVLVFLIVILCICLTTYRALIIRLSLTAIIWIFLLFVSASMGINNLLLLPVIMLTVYIAAVYNNYQFIIMSGVILVLCALYMYILSLRYVFHSALAIIFPAFVILIFSLSDNNKLSLNTNKLKPVPIILAVLFFVSSVFAGYYNFEKTSKNKVSNTRSAILNNYIDAHPKNIFAINQTILYNNYFNPFILTEDKENTVNFGLWVTKSKYIQNSKKRNGVTHLFKDSINSNVRFVMTFSSFDSLKSVNQLETFYNEHYSENGKTIKLVETDNLDGYKIYKVVSR